MHAVPLFVNHPNLCHFFMDASQNTTYYLFQMSRCYHSIVLKASNIFALKFLQIIDGMNLLPIA